MNDVEYILDFVAGLGSRMLYTGANLERVDDTMTRICLSYHLESISIFSLSSTIIVSARSAGGAYGSRQITVPPASIHLEKLNRLNCLSRRICAEKPEPAVLAGLLEEAEQVEEYSVLTVILGYLAAMTSLCVIFGGNILDIVAADCITVALYWIVRWLSRPNLNHIVVNTLCMWFAGTLAIVLVSLGIGEHVFSIIITSSMMMIPGIPLVNSVRNILCGNEMNGIIEFFKVILETIAIVLGLILSIYMFGGLIRW
ncbi:threonine/serine ThrE exporter family protein [Bariatricus sp. SGI.154]|uniref:threonine/serine ThrE exporter family protein n=1 Tax=Bariatricus sp. SGI.154 TaxID=3420549 RepID=UPI003CFF8279